MRRSLPLVLLALLLALPARGQGNRLYLEVGRTFGMVIGDLNERHQEVLARRTPLVDDRSRAGPLIGLGLQFPVGARVDAVAGLQGGGTRMHARAFDDRGLAEGEGTLRFVGARIRLEARSGNAPWQFFIALGVGRHLVHVKYRADFLGGSESRHTHIDGTTLVLSQDAVLGLRRRTGRLALAAEGGYRVGRNDYTYMNDYDGYDGIDDLAASVSGHVFLLRVEWLYKPIRARQERP